MLADAVGLGKTIEAVAYMNRFQIKPEVRALLAKFGPRFAECMEPVRRWSRPVSRGDHGLPARYPGPDAA